ncbi:MAG TPA: HU family DNA-binding protein [Solirubrobacteraceae bacterium]|nr:HU family DNA-binding protein [Solirubrobacteraceae bacterium]
MTKTQLVDAVQTRTGLTRTQSAEALEAVLETVQEVLGRGREVALTGFGRFTVSERGERTGKHPRTGEPMRIAATRVPKFAPASGLKQAVRS